MNRWISSAKPVRKLRKLKIRRPSPHLLESLESRVLMSVSPVSGGKSGSTTVQAAVVALAAGTTTSNLGLSITPDTISATGGATFTATFSGFSGTAPTGTVSLFEVASAGSTTPIATLASAVTIDATGVATFNAPGPFTVGPHYFFASFSGDATYAAENSPTATHTVNKIASSVSLSTNASAPTYGQTVQVTAQVTLADGTTPTLPATLLNTDTNQAIAATTSTGATTTFNVLLSSLTTDLVGSFAGDATHAASQSSTLTINAAKAPTTLNAVAGPYGRTVTIDVGLRAGFPDSLLPTFGGTVTLFEGTTQLGQVTLSGDTSARFVLTTLNVGTHHLSATFTGNDFFADSSKNLTVNIVKIPTTLALSVNSDGSALNIHFNIPSDAPPELLPLLAGNIKLYDGKKLVTTLSPTGSGDISVDLSSWRNGLHRIRAVFSGDMFFKGFATSSLNFILTPKGEKVPPGIAHAPGLDNLGSKIDTSTVDDPAVTTTVTKGNGNANANANKGKGKG